MSLSTDEYRWLVEHELGIVLGDINQEGLGEFADGNRIGDFCDFYLRHQDQIHPIQLAESVDQILESLSDKFETGSVAEADLIPVSQVVLHASENRWALATLVAHGSDHEINTDTGSKKLAQWIQRESDLDMTEIEARHLQFQREISASDAPEDG